MKLIIVIIVSLFTCRSSCKSYMNIPLTGNCLNCINAGSDFCSMGPWGGTVDPINSICCTSMSNVYDVCQTGYDSCTY